MADPDGNLVTGINNGPYNIDSFAIKIMNKSNVITEQ